LPHAVEFLLYILVAGLRRPVDAHASQIFEADFDGTLGVSQGQRKDDAQANDGSPVDDVCRALGQHQESFLSPLQFSGEVLAFSAVELKSKNKLIGALPTVFA
jgi:hypothetical protein